MKNILLFFVLGLIGMLAITSCKTDSSQSIGDLKLKDLLISVDEMPVHPWVILFSSHPVLMRRFDTDTAGVVFYSDLYPKSFSSRENVFRYNSTWDARRDYQYAISEFGGGYFPSGWKFQSELAEESEISCVDNVTGSFTGCYWIARYDRVLVEFSTWLIPERMTLKDVEKIVKKIDDKVDIFIFDK